MRSPWFLCAVLVLLSVAARADLQDAFNQAMNGGDWSRAAELSLKVVERHPDSAVAAYNAACAIARAGRPDEALDQLQRAVTLGFTGIASIDQDADLHSVRSLARFASIRRAVEANVAARFARFRAVAERVTSPERLPPDHDAAEPTPLLVVLHGTGGTGAQMIDAWAEVADTLGAIVLAPDALRPVAGTRGYSWTYRDEARWLVLREVAAARDRYAVSKVVLSGFSQGANVAFMLGQAHPEVFDGVIPVSGHFEADLAETPAQVPRHALPRWFLLIGQRDPWVATYALAQETLVAAGAQVEVRQLPRLGHAMPGGRRGREHLHTALVWALGEE